MANRYDVDPSNAIEWDHEGNRGLLFSLLSIPVFTGGGRWQDATGRTTGAALVNGPTWGSSPRGVGLVLDGSDDYASLPYRPLYNSGLPFAWSGWCRATVGNRVIVSESTASNNPIWMIAAGADTGANLNGLRLFIRADNSGTLVNATSTVNVVNVEWFHFLVYDSGAGGYAAWVDGNPVFSGSYTRGTLTLSTLSIGALLRTALGGALAGGIADLRLWVGRQIDNSFAIRNYELARRPYWEDPRIRTLTGVMTFAPLSISYRPRPRTLQRLIGAGL
jgi:Concanavalin A-like lectin/glucanases superfamily